VTTGETGVTLAVSNGDRVDVRYDDIVRGNLMDGGLTR
jgi:hypothetical protein